jgi:hypothetical protein
MSNVTRTNGPAGGTMHVDTGEFAALRDQVAELAEEVSRLRQHALILRAIEDSALERAGYTPQTSRVRHLRVIGDDAS